MQERNAVPAEEIKEERAKQEKAQKKPAWRLSQRKKALIRWAILGVVVVYAGITLAMQQRTISMQKQEAKELQERQEQMQQDLEFLKEKEAYTGTDAYIERAAREKFGWVKDGEIIFRKQEETQGVGDAAAPSEPVSSAPAEE